MVTYPYRPPVWATASNDTPLVVEGDHKLPTRSGRLSYMAHRNGKMPIEAGPHENTIHKIPEPQNFPWKVSPVTF